MLKANKTYNYESFMEDAFGPKGTHERDDAEMEVKKYTKAFENGETIDDEDYEDTSEE